MFAEIAFYAFWGFVAWGLIALIGYTLHFLQLKIKTRQAVLDKLNELHVELEMAIEECEDARIEYERLAAEFTVRVPAYSTKH